MPKSNKHTHNHWLGISELIPQEREPGNEAKGSEEIGHDVVHHVHVAF